MASTATVRKQIELNEDDVNWFYRTYPDASLQAMLQMLLSKYREVTEFTPEHYARVAAEHIKELE